MNILKEVKETIFIRDYLSKIGIEPVRTNRNLYPAPYREDKKASMLISQDGTHFVDLATGDKGSVIDLHAKINNIDFNKALADLYATIGSTIYTKNQKERVNLEKLSEPQSSKIKIDNILPLENPILLSYLKKERGVSLEVAQKHCKEISFSFYGKETKLFGIAFENNSKGYEIRNKIGKYATNKDITHIDKGSPNTYIFEGFMDYLSYLTLLRVPFLNDNVIVLNSVINLSKAENILKQATKVVCYLDNDNAGKQCFENIQNLRGDKSTLNASCKLFPNHKDLNEFLMEKQHKTNRLAKPILKLKI